MNTIPTYALYGDTGNEFALQWLHCESIFERSSRFNWEIAPHRHGHLFQFLLVTKGTGVCTTEDGERALRPNTLVIIPPGYIHGFRFSHDVQGHVVTFLIEKLDMLLGDTGALAHAFATPQIVTLPRGKPQVRHIIHNSQALADEFSHSRAGRESLVSAHLSVILVEAARLIALSIDAKDPQMSLMTRHARHFQRLVDQNFKTQRAISFYADQIGISQTHLNRVCRDMFNCSALEVVNRRLTIEASRELIFTVMSVKEISYALGFDDPAYFTRFFTKNCGITPTQFRCSHVAQKRPVRAQSRPAQANKR